tara:strand:+ start:657 stop:1691 length:1035 start_codon:yes stop_codon:yes gene_type:complete
MKEIKNYEENTTRYILETVGDVDDFNNEICRSFDHDGVANVLGHAEGTMPLMREMLASNLDLVVSIRIEKQEGYKPKIVIPKIKGINNNSKTCAALYHREDLDTPIASIGFNTYNQKYVLRNKAIKRGGEERGYWDSSLKESKHFRPIMEMLIQTMSRIVPKPYTFLEPLLSQCEDYRYRKMSEYIDNKEVAALSVDEIQHMIDSGYAPTPHSLLARVIDNYRDNFDAYDRAKKYSPMVYHVRKIVTNDDVYIAKFRYPSWADTEGSKYANSHLVRKYLIDNPIKEVRYKHTDIPTYIERTMAMLDLKDSTSNSTSSYIEGMGIKISSNRYWAIDENNEVNLDV